MKNRKGFTLVELMILVAILGILSVVGLDGIKKVKELKDKQITNGKESPCRTEIN